MLRLSKAKTSAAKHANKKRHSTRWAVVVVMLVFVAAAGILFAAYWLYCHASDEAFHIPFIGGLIGGGGQNSEAPPVPEQTFEDYLADTIFIGDSRTNGLAGYGYVPKSNVFAIDGSNHVSARTEKFITLSGTSRKLTIAQASELIRPARMIVSYGINGIAFMDSDTFLSEYAALLEELRTASPETLLVVQSILPVSAEKAAATPGMSNRAIDSCNQKLKALVEEKGGVFLDSSAVLKNAKGNLDSKYNSGDGLHFNRTAYLALLDFYDQNRLY